MKVEADDSSCHGHIAMDRMSPMYAPRRMLTYEGKSPAMSMPVEKALSIVLIASWQTTSPRPAKNAAARDLAL